MKSDQKDQNDWGQYSVLILTSCLITVGIIFAYLLAHSEFCLRFVRFVAARYNIKDALQIVECIFSVLISGLFVACFCLVLWIRRKPKTPEPPRACFQNKKRND